MRRVAASPSLQFAEMISTLKISSIPVSDLIQIIKNSPPGLGARLLYHPPIQERLDTQANTEQAIEIIKCLYDNNDINPEKKTPNNKLLEKIKLTTPELIHWLYYTTARQTSPFAILVSTYENRSKITTDADLKTLCDLLTKTHCYTKTRLALCPLVHLRLCELPCDALIAILQKDDQAGPRLANSRRIAKKLANEATTAQLVSLIQFHSRAGDHFLGENLVKFNAIQQRLTHELSTKQLDEIKQISHTIKMHLSNCNIKNSGLMNWAWSACVGTLTSLVGKACGEPASVFAADLEGLEPLSSSLKDETIPMLLHRVFLMCNIISLRPASEKRELKHIVRQLMPLESRSPYRFLEIVSGTKLLIAMNTGSHRETRVSIFTALRPKNMRSNTALQMALHAGDTDAIQPCITRLFSIALLGIEIPDAFIKLLFDLQQFIETNPEIAAHPPSLLRFNSAVKRLQTRINSVFATHFPALLTAIKPVLKKPIKNPFTITLRAYLTKHHLDINTITSKQMQAMSKDPELRAAIFNLFPAINLISIAKKTLNELCSNPDVVKKLTWTDDTEKHRIITHLYLYAVSKHSNVASIARYTRAPIALRASNGLIFARIPEKSIIIFPLRTVAEQYACLSGIDLASEPNTALLTSFGTDKRRCPAEHVIVKAVLGQIFEAYITHLHSTPSPQEEQKKSTAFAI